VVLVPSTVQRVQPGSSGRSRGDPIPPCFPINYRLIVVTPHAGDAILGHPVEDLLGPFVGALAGNDVTRMDEDISGS